MWSANIGTTSIGCLHHIAQKGCHVEVFGQQENVAEILDCSRLHRDWHIRFRYLLQHELEDVLYVI